MCLICALVMVLSPLQVISTILALIQKDCSKYLLIKGISGLILAIFFYGNLLGFTFCFAFEVAALSEHNKVAKAEAQRLIGIKYREYKSNGGDMDYNAFRKSIAKSRR